MAFTADNVLKWAESQYGIKGGQSYWDFWNSENLGSWCCAGVCTDLCCAGRDIGLWINCGTSEANRGIQFGFKKAGFKKVKTLKEACKGAMLIMHWPTSKYEYDHVCIWYGTYDSDGKVKTANFNVSGTNGIRYYPVDQIVAIWVPDYQTGTGWNFENGKYRHYTDFKPDKDKMVKGEGKYAGQWFYVNSSGYVVTNQIVKYKGNYYYCGKSGAVQCGGTVVLDCGDDGVLHLP